MTKMLVTYDIDRDDERDKFREGLLEIGFSRLSDSAYEAFSLAYTDPIPDIIMGREPKKSVSAFQVFRLINNVAGEKRIHVFHANEVMVR